MIRNEGQRDDPQQAIVGLLHLLEFAGPDDVVALGENDAGLGVVDFSLGLRDRRGQIAVADAELDRQVAPVVLAVDVGGPGFVSLDLG